jgi:hypothetical protein
MTDLAEFLLARIAEDEAVAREAVRWSEGASQWGDSGEPDWEHIARHDPARVLAECDAKRRIVQMLEDDDPGEWGDGALRHLASVCADHPDCRDEWRP